MKVVGGARQITSGVSVARRTARLTLWSGLLLAAATSAGSSAQNAINYSYDSQGRLVSVDDAAGWSTDYQFDPTSNRTNVRVVNQFSRSWAMSQLGHQIGKAEAGGWSAGGGDPYGYLSYGPSVTDVPAGSHAAAFRMLVDNNDADNANVVVLDVFDATDNYQIATRTVTRREWRTTYSYEVFEVPFTLAPGRVGHSLQFRVLWLSTSYVRQNRVGLR